jgi:homoserine O-acetyltransferase/O-succinyltransferase
MKKFFHSENFVLESGLVLPQVEVAYQTYGHLSPAGDNVIWVFHALTANADVASWWSGLFGNDKTLDPDTHFIVCANLLGSCYGTTGPSSIHPHTNLRYGLDFPLYTIRDMVRVHQLLAKHLHIQKIAIGIGGSLGGQQLLEWACMEPERFEHLIAIATNAQHSPWGIAFNASQRMALESDSTLKSNTTSAGESGLRAARAIALLSYRNYITYEKTQHECDITIRSDYPADLYQRHQGEKLVHRFDAHTYYRLTQAMDSHHVGRDRGGMIQALANIASKTLIIGIESDVLFPSSEQEILAQYIPGATLEIIPSIYGHDGFLIETDAIQAKCKSFLTKKTLEKTKPNKHSVIAKSI